MSPLPKAVFEKLAKRGDLSVEESRSVFEMILSGRLEPAAIGWLLGALAAKGECVDELVGAAQAMRTSAIPIRCGAGCIDTCGTGGDGLSFFNASTTAAIIAAAAGATVAKHGNRSTTRASGSTEVLAELGVNVEAGCDVVERCLADARIGYLNARLLHPAMRHAAPIRQALPGRTIFNLLGPLTNPAGAKRHLLGVPRKDLAPRMAQALLKLGTEHAWVVCGDAGGGRGVCDVTITGPTLVLEVKDDRVREFSITPTQFGLHVAPAEDLLVRSPKESAEIVLCILRGRTGAARDHTLLNAGAALVIAGLADDLVRGMGLAAAAIDDGRAQDTLARWKEASNENPADSSC